jgi:hypothetical protein
MTRTSTTRAPTGTASTEGKSAGAVLILYAIGVAGLFAISGT